MVITGTMESQEICKPCKGTGWLGTAGKYNLFCETCMGSGSLWIERGTVSNNLLSFSQDIYPRSRMKFKLAMAVILGMISLGGFAVTAGAAPPPPLTQVTDISYAGGGHYLSACAAVGNLVYFENPGGCTSNIWYAQLEGTTGGKYYYWHPLGNLNYCMTASTTQFGVIKIENCVGAQNQFWWNPNNGYGLYHLTNYYWDQYLNDPTGGNGAAAGLTLTSQGCAYAGNGCTMEQS
jgi:hypothetical protein